MLRPWLAVLMLMLGCSMLDGGPKSQPPGDPADALVGHWSFAAFGTAPGTQPALPETELDAEFTADGQVRGSAGCNRYFGSYEVPKPGTLVIGPLASTRKACPEPIMAQEGRFLAMLTGATKFHVDRDQLEVGYDAGGGALAFERAPGQESRAPEPVPTVEDPTIAFDLAQLNGAGLRGPPDGLRALSYEFCIPAQPEREAEVRRIDPTLELQPRSPGRIGCDAPEVLCVGSTHQPDFRGVLVRLAALPYVERIEEATFE